jgi:L-ascorbate metabolism protein UlaG (beta-lactamase superfamily)
VARGAGFLINARGTLVAIDPAISHAPGSKGRGEFGVRRLDPLPIEAAAVPRLDLVCVSHADPDDLAPLTARELIRAGANFAGPTPVAARLRDLGVAEGHLRAVKRGDRLRVSEVEIVVTRADHA